MYAMARRGEIKNFTGIDDPYERPENAEMILDTEACTAEENAHAVVEYLTQEGFIRSEQPVSA
jgi:adenylylsulfate kinase-like enzyme